MSKRSSIAVCIVTYNQEKYIDKAIESVISQKISVPVTIFIGEDCSTDRTKQICISYKERYSNIELIPRDVNIGLVRNTIDIFKRIISSKIDYIAMLDGDDYWTDEYKLQKQYDILKEHSDYGFVHTNVALLVNDKIQIKLRKNVPTGDVFDVVDTFSIINCSTFFRTSLLQKIHFDDFISNKFMSLDYAMYAIFSKYTKFEFIEDSTAVWRRGHTSISSTNDMYKQIEYIDNDDKMWKYVDSLFPGRFRYNEEINGYRNYRIFNIAFQYGNFELAKKMSNEPSILNYHNGIIFEIKKRAARTKILFLFWCWTKKTFKK